MWELDYKGSWALNNWCFWTVLLEMTLESPLDCKEIQPVHPKGDQSWVFIGRTDAEAETPILWPSDAKSWLIGKHPDAGKIEGRRRRGYRGWDGWMASLTEWTWVWVSSGSWWWTGKPGVLQFMGSQRVGHNWATYLVSPSLWGFCFCQAEVRNGPPLHFVLCKTSFVMHLKINGLSTQIGERLRSIRKPRYKTLVLIFTLH